MTIDFNRRTLGKAAAILSASLGAPMLAGCSGPQHHADNRMMPGTVFTPEALKATAKGKTYVRDFVAVYGRPLRRMNDHVRHPDQKGYVWEWVATRPSFCSNLNDRPYMTPTVKKEIHVWRRNIDAVVTDVEVVGTFYVDSCMAIKITIDRPNLSASPDEHDVFGAQQQSVLEALRVPVYAHHPADAVAQ